MSTHVRSSISFSYMLCHFWYCTNYNVKNVFLWFRFRHCEIVQDFSQWLDESLTLSYVVSCNANTLRHLSKGAISVSVPISSDIGTLVTQLLSSSFNHSIFKALIIIIIMLLIIYFHQGKPQTKMYVWLGWSEPSPNKKYLYMGESPKFPKSWTFEIRQVLKLDLCLQFATNH